MSESMTPTSLDRDNMFFSNLIHLPPVSSCSFCSYWKFCKVLNGGFSFSFVVIVEETKHHVGIGMYSYHFIHLLYGNTKNSAL